MSLLRKSVRNISIVAASQLITWLAAFVFTVAQANYLGPERFGQLSLALAYAAFFTIAVDFGLGMQLSRLVAQRSERLGDAAAATVVLRAGLWLVAMPVAWLITTLLGYGRELQETILVLTGSVLFVSLASVIGAYLQGREEFFLPSAASVAYRVAAAAIGVILLMLGQGIVAVAGAYVVASAINLIVLLLGLRGKVAIHARIDPRTTLTILRGAVPLALYWIVGAFYFNVDMAMLERMAPAENVGWYAAAYRLFNAAAIAPAIVTGMVLYPVFSRLSLDSHDELRRVIEKAFTFLAIAGGAALVVLVLLPEGIVAFLYPARSYAAAANALRLLAPGLLFLYLNSVFAYSLFGLNRERRLMEMAIAAAVLNPLANLVAIPLLQQDGAAIITSLTELFLLGWLVRVMPRELLSREIPRVAAKACLAAAAAAFVVLPVREQPLVVTLPLALVAYAATAFALRAVPHGDLRALVALLRPMRPPAAPAVEMAGADPALGHAVREKAR